MPSHKFIILIMLPLILLIIPNIAGAQYWFQVGARSANDLYLNNGFSVAIQTIYQNPRYGSVGFWTGEHLSNGAFIQVGYEVVNATGYYLISCENVTKKVFLVAGHPTWFWEYFKKGTNDSFCGGIGQDGSAGLNGSFNTYSFISSGNTIWRAYFNRQLLGQVDLGTNNSGPNAPYSIGEYTTTNTNKWFMKSVRFNNMLAYLGNIPTVPAIGYSYLAYGSGSLTNLPNLYGAEEIGKFSDYFSVGSNTTISNSTILWKSGSEYVAYVVNTSATRHILTNYPLNNQSEIISIILIPVFIATISAAIILWLAYYMVSKKTKRRSKYSE